MDDYLENLPPEVEARLIEAVDGLVDGTLPPRLLAQVEQDLKQYQAARELWNSICLQRSMLLDYFREENTLTGQDYADLASKISDIDQELTSVIAPERKSEEPSAQPDVPSLGYLQGTMQFFSHNAFVLSVVVLLGLTLLTATYFTINYFDRRVPSQPQAMLVAQITDTKDCRWAAAVPVEKMGHLAKGQQLNLEKGLVQITYYNGAVVLLEGPASYTLDSPKSGVLASGRLFAQADTNQSHGFTIATPNAHFTDLGTAFGVKIDAKDFSELHVFSGVVEVRSMAKEGTPSEVLRLTQGKAARVDSTCRVESLPQADPNEFVKKMDSPRAKKLDLLDVVAGGNGLNTDWKEGGINPTTGNRNDSGVSEIDGNGQYHRVEGSPLVNGIFIPTGKNTQLDAAGHSYDFPKTDNMISRFIFLLHKSSIAEDKLWGSKGIIDYDYMPSGRGLMGMHANSGFTFDLEEIRKAHPGWTPGKFSATMGNVFSKEGVDINEQFNEWAEVWIFVDGQIRVHREKVAHADGVIPIDVELSPSDRFLTLVVTDRVGNHKFNQVIFGDPVLQLKAAD